MLTQVYRPSRFADVVGQEEAVTVLRAIALRPDTAPRVVILHGAWGTGKTSLARIFGHALNCLSKKGDSCGKCEVCCAEDSFNPLYQENDSSMMGNVEFIRGYRERLEQTSPPEGQYRTIVFDEVQEASSQSMDAMLKVLEDTPERTFFCFCTTALDKIHTTIRSRAVELPLRTIHTELITRRLLDIATLESFPLSEGVARQIALGSGGHMRDAVMRLDVYSLCEDKATFSNLISTCEDSILRFLEAARGRDRVTAEKCVQEMMHRPLAYLFRDWEMVALDLLKGFSGDPDPRHTKVLGLYGADVFRIMRALASDWSTRCFRDDLMYQAFLWYLYYEFGKEIKKTVSASSSFQK